jgi:hypothetical protein
MREKEREARGNAQAKEDVLGDKGLGTAAHDDGERDGGDAERDRDVDRALLAQVGREGDDDDEDGGHAVDCEGER